MAQHLKIAWTLRQIADTSGYLPCFAGALAHHKQLSSQFWMRLGDCVSSLCTICVRFAGLDNERSISIALLNMPTQPRDTNASYAAAHRLYSHPPRNAPAGLSNIRIDQCPGVGGIVSPTPVSPRAARLSRRNRKGKGKWRAGIIK